MTVTDARPARRRGWDWYYRVGLAWWFAGFLWHWWRPPPMFVLDVAIIPATTLGYWFGFVAVIVGAVGGRRWMQLITLVPVVIVLSALVNPGWIVAPRTWFTMHRPLLNLALETDPGHEYYGNKLPLSLRFLTADGKVSDEDQDGSRFFAQWFGIPDDAGGYIYSPGKSPEGKPLYGLWCKDPTDLGDGWWMCGLRDNGL